MNKYEDIIYLPHHVSDKRKAMSLYNRASQFAPFSALTGYNEKIRETARITSKKIILDEGRKTILNDKLLIISKHIKEKPKVTITYFVPDKKKSGGEYKTLTSNVKVVDDVYKQIILKNGAKIFNDDIINITIDLYN